MTPLRPVLLVAACMLAFPAAAQDRRPPTVDDLLDLVQVSGAEISPDGQQVIYEQSALAKWSDNKRVSTIWIVRSDGRDARPLLASDKDRSPRWAPDGRSVAFLSTRDQAENARDAAGAQLWLLPMSGGEAVKLTSHPAAIRGFRWSDDSTRVFFTADEADTDAQKDARKYGGDGIFVDEGANGQGRSRYANLWVLTLADKSTRRLTSGDQIVTEFVPSPDGSQVAYLARPTNTRNQQNRAEVYVLPTTGGTPARLTTNEAPESRLAWAPNGRSVSYIAPHTKTWELAQGQLYVQPIEASAGPTAISGSFQGNINDYYWRDGAGSVVVGGSLRGRSGVFELDVASGRARALTTGDVALSISSSSRDRTRLAGTRSLPGKPAEIAVVDVPRAEVRDITDANPWFAHVAVSQMRAITWKSTDGLEVEGLLWLPANYQPGQRLPLALSIHGGPAGVWATSFRGINHVYTALGWAVLEPNVRGSTSYGDALLRGNMKDIGFGDYHDAMTGVDALIAQGIADPNQLAVRGWSYGGILGGWTVTQTARFKAASLGAMVTDWASEYAMGFNHDVRLWYIGGTPWDNPEGYRKHSSYSYIHQVKTPTLLLHGEQDDTCTIGQSMMFYQGLKDRDVPTRFIRFPREPHGFREPHHIRMRDAEELRWLMKHTRGLDWSAGDRRDDTAEKKTATQQ